MEVALTVRCWRINGASKAANGNKMNFRRQKREKKKELWFHEKKSEREWERRGEKREEKSSPGAGHGLRLLLARNAWIMQQLAGARTILCFRRPFVTSRQIARELSVSSASHRPIFVHSVHLVSHLPLTHAILCPFHSSFREATPSHRNRGTINNYHARHPHQTIHSCVSVRRIERWTYIHVDG